ncbi:MAG: LysM peptidoglycan-binding domain-containing protein [Gammaproteobacteria bacterium]|nr:LysM peptidoglycan-binding domain-containing protein [Gammaproteobacteria bacterium]
MSNTTPAVSLVRFSVGSYLICVNAEEVVATIAAPAIAHLPLTPSFVLGAFLYQQEVAAAVDLRPKLGLVDAASDGVLVIARHHVNPYVAIRVDAVDDMADASLSWRPVDEPAFLFECQHQGQRYLFSSMARLFDFAQQYVPAAVPHSAKVVRLPPAQQVRVGTRVGEPSVAESASGSVVTFPTVERSPEPVEVVSPQPMTEVRRAGSGRRLAIWTASMLASLAVIGGGAAWMTASAPNQAVPGQRLVIDTPSLRIQVQAKADQLSLVQEGAADVTHRVTSGDTLWGIAARYLGDPYQFPALVEVNDIKNPDLIYPGEVVKIYRK